MLTKLKKVFKDSPVVKKDSGVYIVANDLIFAKSLHALVRGVAKNKPMMHEDALWGVVPKDAVHMYLGGVLVAEGGKPRMGQVATYLCSKYSDVELVVIIKRVWGLDVSVVPQFGGWHAA